MMLKQILTVAIAALYLTLTSGVSIYSHYCRGELLSASILVDQKKSCVCSWWAEQKGETSDCCHDEFDFVKIGDQHNPATGSDISPVFFHAEIHPFAEPIAVITRDPAENYRPNGPPGKVTPRFIRYHRLQFYG